jgi:hypothetical protein
MCPFPRCLTWLAGTFFLLGALFYTGMGFKRFFSSTLSPIDYRLRWVEQQYFYQGINPYDVSIQALNHEDPVISSRAKEQVISSLGHPPTLGYPPWAHVIQVPLIPPATPFSTARILFAAANLAAMALTAGLLWTASTQFGLSRAQAFASTAGCLSVASLSTTLGNGQYGILVNAMILLGIHQLSRNRQLAAAVAISLALLKPTNSGPFFFLLARRCRLRALIACLAITALFSIVFWVTTGVHPLRALVQMVTYTAESMGARAPWNQTLLSWVISLGVPTPAATAILGLVGLLLSALIGFRAQSRSWLVQAAAFGVIARLWTKHFSYDNLLIIFLLFALAVLYFKHRSLTHLSWLTAVGLTLWLPSGWFDHFGTALAQILIWCAATCFLLLPSTSKHCEEQN